MIDIEFEHNHSLETLEAAEFRDISSDCADKIYTLYESGHTRSTARQQYMKEIRETCTNDLEFHKKKADRSVVPRRRDFNSLYTQFGNERFGGRGVMMFSKLVEKLEEYKTENPKATVSHQAPVVQRLDNAIHRINHYPADSMVCFVNIYPLDSDLSGG